MGSIFNAFRGVRSCQALVAFESDSGVLSTSLPRGEVKSAVFLRPCAQLRITELGQASSKREVLAQELDAVLEAFYDVYLEHYGDPEWLSSARMGHGYRLHLGSDTRRVRELVLAEVLINENYFTTNHYM